MYADDHQFYAVGSTLSDVHDDLAICAESASTECIKLLVICIDNNLRFDEHISRISNKSAQRVGVLLRLRNLIPPQTKLQLYKAAVLPYLTYRHLIWHFCRASDSRAYPGKST